MSDFINYHILDVFTEQAYGGNPLAIFESEISLSTAQMQKIAKELNLSESVFILSGKENFDREMRIFTPSVELPTAGHPTIGTACFLRNHLNFRGKEANKYRLKQKVGIIEVDLVETKDEEFEALMHQPLPTFKETFKDQGLIAALLQLQENEIDADMPSQIIDCGNPFLIVSLKNLDAIKAIKLNTTLYNQIVEEFNITGLMTFCPQTEVSDHSTHSRMFAPHIGVPEDPATGSAHGPLAAYLYKYSTINIESGIVGEQGYEIGRPSQVKMRIEAQQSEISSVLVGGKSVYMGNGKIRLPDG
jgi:trans-2,3-dihydro-3-hydroxyanthranilate isomerase